jgi:hypothetical protein
VNAYRFERAGDDRADDDRAGDDGAGEPRRVLWTDERTDVTVRTADPVQVTDLMGNTQTLSPVDGEVYLTVGPDPLYLDGSIDGIEAGTPVGAQGGAGARGDVVPLTLRADAPTTFAVDGERFEVDGGAERVTVPADYDANRSVAVLGLRRQGKRIGRLTTALSIAPDPVTLAVHPRIDGGEQTLTVDLQNLARERSYTPDQVRWQLGEQSGTVDLEGGLEANSSRGITIPLSDVANWRGHDATIRVEFADRPAVEVRKSITFAPVHERSITVDGTLDDMGEVPSVSLPADGRDRLDPARDGAEDLNGEAWVTYDDENLYLTARITDDTHTEGWPLWEHDSIQLGVADGYPARGNHSEFQIARSPDGPRIFRLYQPSGPRAAVLQSASVDVRRQEDAGVTIYEAAIPWADLRADPDGPTSLSILVNENDGSGRAGWIEWGGGIGDSKDASQFRAVQFVSADAATDDGGPDSAETDGSSTTTSAADGDGSNETAAPGFGVPAVSLAVVLGILLSRRRREH